MRDEGVTNFDDVNKTVFCIPYNPNDAAETGPPEPPLLPRSFHDERDLENGRELRLVAYKDAWKKCLSRMQDTVHQLQKSSVKSVVQEVRTSYLNVLPGLPYPELPVVSVINPALGSAFLNNITAQLEEEDPSLGPKCSIIHLYPGDFPNVSTGMRSIISSFVDKTEMLERVKRKPATSLASYDIKYLVVWYRAWIESINATTNQRPNLVIVLHDFEQFDPLVMQDIFYICSGHVSRLPLVFLLSMSSPLSNYLNVTYTRVTLSLLRVRNFTTPTGREILQEILLKTFFDPDFEPGIMIGPTTIGYLQDYFTGYHSTVDTILTIIQFAYMKHFTAEPLTLLAHTTPSIEVLSQPNSSAFSKYLIARTAVHGDEDIEMEDRDTRLDFLVNTIDEARIQFYTSVESLRLAFAIMILIQTFLEKQGYKGLEWSVNVDKGRDLCGAMVELLKGSLSRDVKKLLLIAMKLKRDELNDLLESIYQFFTIIQSHAKYQETRSKIVMMRGNLARDPDDKPDTFSQVSTEFNEWLANYMDENLTPLEDATLWDVWYIGLSPFPAEILNPSIRASLMAGLLRPFEFADDLAGKININPDAKSIWELPDTSIIFKRYLDSGKMINVYDWFESFKSVLDTQRTHIRELALQSETPSPKKRGKAKAKVKSQRVEIAEDDEEKWSIEVQARFIRALHELDYLGFIKHTGRKADHVLRTVFDINDAE